MKFGTCISVVALMTAFSAVDANAAIDVTIKEVGSDVVMTTAGSINRSGLTPYLSCNFFARLSVIVTPMITAIAKACTPPWLGRHQLPFIRFLACPDA